MNPMSGGAGFTPEQAEMIVRTGQQSVHLLQWACAFLFGLFCYFVGRG